MSAQGFFTSPMEEADGAFKSGDFAKAAELYRGIATGDPGNSHAWRCLAISLIQTGAIDEALEASQKAAALQPGSADCRYAHGYALGAVKRFPEAITELDAALNLQPNHGPARQVLIFALIQHGRSLVDSDPRHAENCFERAYKLDHRNAGHIAPYLEHLRTTGQKGKAAQLVNSFDDGLKSDPNIKPILDKMHEDPAFHTVLQQAAMAKDNVVAKAVVQAPTQSSINYVPCPNCRQQIADYAAICPHCNFQNRAVGSFAGRDTGPNYEWQEIAYTVVSVIWLLNAGWSIFTATQMETQARNYFLTLAIANGGVGLGLLFRMEMVMVIAKFFCMVNLMFGSIFFVVALMQMKIGDLLAALFTVSLAGFLIYLINYNSDV
jgi:tetratricopeptide (TPR) repeat protein